MKRFALCAVFVAIIAFCATGSLFAQEDKTYHTPVNTINYNVYGYPSGTAHFYLPPRFETEFQTVNGKFFAIEFDNFIGETGFKFDIYFYTPCGKEFGKVHVNTTSREYSIPHKANTLACENITVKIVNRSKTDNKNFKMFIYEPKDSVMGVPNPKAKVVYDENCDCEAHTK